MLVAQLSRFGRPEEVIELVEQPDPEAPGAGEVLIEAELFPVDPADLENLAGNYGATPPALPMVVGRKVSELLPWSARGSRTCSPVIGCCYPVRVLGGSG